jgi:hypothetical protein
MNRLLTLLLTVFVCQNACAFAPVARSSVSTGFSASIATPPTGFPTTTALGVFGNKKSAAAKTEEESKYWQGEWVCKDCGYIYNRVRTKRGVGISESIT